MGLLSFSKISLSVGTLPATSVPGVFYVQIKPKVLSPNIYFFKNSTSQVLCKFIDFCFLFKRIVWNNHQSLVLSCKRQEEIFGPVKVFLKQILSNTNYVSLLYIDILTSCFLLHHFIDSVFISCVIRTKFGSRGRLVLIIWPFVQSDGKAFRGNSIGILLIKVSIETFWHS